MADNRVASYKIMNTIGQEVLRGTTKHVNINVSNLENGIYILRINDNQKTITKKFIKK